MNEVIDVTQKPSMPARIFHGVMSGISSALGALITRDFWLDLGARVIREMINAFMKTLGAKFLTYGSSREDPDVKRAAAAANNTGGNSAFSSASSYPATTRYGSDPTYRGNYGGSSFPSSTPTAPRTETKFPGW